MAIITAISILHYYAYNHSTKPHHTTHHPTTYLTSPHHPLPLLTVTPAHSNSYLELQRTRPSTVARQEATTHTLSII